VNFYTFLAKIFLKNFQEIELHALGNSLSVCARLAERLDRFKLGKMVSIRTFTYVNKEETEDSRRPSMKKVKMIVKVKRTSEYYDLVDVD